MSRYSGDLIREDQCREICRNDPQCAAYSWGYPLCSIFGTVRRRAPEGSGHRWSFQMGTTPRGVSIEQALLVPGHGQRETVCRRRGTEADQEDDSTQGFFQVDDFLEPVRLTGFFLLLLCCFFALPVYRTLRGGSHAKSEPEKAPVEPLQNQVVTVGTPVQPDPYLFSNDNNELRKAGDDPDDLLGLTLQHPPSRTPTKDNAPAAMLDDEPQDPRVVRVSLPAQQMPPDGGTPQGRRQSGDKGLAASNRGYGSMPASSGADAVASGTALAAARVGARVGGNIVKGAL
jgi:hypothetical protein